MPFLPLFCMSMIGAKQALSLLEQLDISPQKPRICLAIEKAVGYRLSEPIYSDRDHPPFRRCLVDGFALSAFPAAVPCTVPVVALEDVAQSVGLVALEIATGFAVPKNFALVVKKEDGRLVRQGDREYFCIDTMPSRQETAIEEQAAAQKKGQQIFAAGKRIDANVVGVLAAIGKKNVAVFAKPSVHVLSNGDELIASSQLPKAHEIRDSNNPYLVSVCEQFGLMPQTTGPIADDPALLLDALKRAAQSDVVLVTGGASVGKKDFIVLLLQQLGYQTLFHRVAQRPGKPMFVGKNQNKFAFSLPGNPLAVKVNFHFYVKPILARLSGALHSEDSACFFALQHDVQPNAHLDLFLLFDWADSKVGQSIRLLQPSSSGDLFAASLAVGFCYIARSNQVVPAQTLVPCYFW